ncbi:Hsp70 family protein [Aestuariivirga sp.]|uniref:Hsp70 family protein n=1 Tax=Aestuariivirga sp. TaxID=2650926 RepID=UPI00359439B4
MNVIGVDFGTTNTVLAFPDGNGACVHRFARDGQLLEAARTTLSFRRSPKPGGLPLAEAGPWAIQDFIDSPEDTRFLQSFKSFAASASFTDTAVFTRRYKFEDLLQAFLGRLREHSGLRDFPQRIVIGRPVTFAGQSPDDALAQRRYETALKVLGFTDITYVLEPVAAAHFYAQGLKRDAVILVGDFGGGTSDFSILRFKATPKGATAEALAHSGIGIAGDSFDYRIIDNVVSPRLGKHATYKSWGKTLPVPIHYFASFSRWNELCLMQRPEVLRELRDLARNSSSRAELQSLVDLIEGGVSYELYRTVSQVKAKLSEQELAEFSFNASGVNIEAAISRSDFEKWIAEDLEKIGRTADDAIAKAGLVPADIDRVFLTGGTSFVPAVRHLFERRFPADRIDTGEQLLSIAKGLALIGAGDEAEKWAAA